VPSRRQSIELRRPRRRLPIRPGQRIRDEQPETTDYGAGCALCHDPHNGDFRLIRKGVISAILERCTDPYSTLYNVKPANETELNGLMNERGADGKRTARAMRLDRGQRKLHGQPQWQRNERPTRPGQGLRRAGVVEIALRPTHGGRLNAAIAFRCRTESSTHPTTTPLVEPFARPGAFA